MIVTCSVAHRDPPQNPKMSTRKDRTATQILGEVQMPQNGIKPGQYAIRGSSHGGNNNQGGGATLNGNFGDIKLPNTYHPGSNQQIQTAIVSGRLVITNW